MLVNWEDIILLFKPAVTRYVSLPGSLEFVKLSTGASKQNETKDVNFHITIVQLHQSHDHSDAAGSMPSLFQANSHNQKRLLPSDIFPHYYHIEKTNDSDFPAEPRTLYYESLNMAISRFSSTISWSKAHTTCRNLNLTLPYFSSSHQLERFAGIFKGSWYVPPLEAVYIQQAADIRAEVSTQPLLSQTLCQCQI